MAFKIDRNYVDVIGLYEKDGVKEIVRVRIWGNGFQKDLERIVLEANARQPEPVIDEGIDNYSSRQTDEEITDYVLSTNNKRKSKVPYLGKDILGIYSPKEDWSYVVEGLTPIKENYVLHHEFGHRLDVHLGLEPTEASADAYARAVTGTDPFPNRLNYN